MADSTMTQFLNEGDIITPSDTENANSAGSSPGEQTADPQTQSPEGEQTPADSTDEDGKKRGAGFADDPAWKEREGTWQKRFNDQETRHAKAIEDLRTEFEKRNPQKPEGQPAPADAVPEWFGGEDTDWKSFLHWQQERLAAAVAEAVRPFQPILQKEDEQKRTIEATQFFENEVKAIEEDKKLNPSREKITQDLRNKILKTAEDFDLVDSKGQWNYRAAWRFLKNSRPSNTAGDNARRALSDGSIDDSGDGTITPQSVRTSEDFSGKSWGSL